MITPELLFAIVQLGSGAMEVARALLDDDPVDAVARLTVVMPDATHLALQDVALQAAQRKRAGL